MSTTSLPSYEELADQIKALPKNDQKKAVDAMKKEATSDKTKRALAEQVKELRDVAIEIDQGFDTVALQLKEVDVIAEKDGWEGHQSLYPGWVEIQTNFRTVLLESRKSALDLAFYIKRFSEKITGAMKRSNLTREQKQEILKDFQKTWPVSISKDGKVTQKNQSDVAWDYTQRFRGLVDQVNIYVINFQKLGAKQKKLWDNEVDELNTKISKIKRELEEIQSRIVKWSAILGVTVTVSAIGVGAALVCLGPIGPVVAAGIAIVGLIATGVLAKQLKDALDARDDKQLELKQAEDKLKDTQDKLDRLKKVTGTLMNNTQLVQGIVGRIGKFEDIWKALAAQIQTVENHLKATIEDESDYLFELDIQDFVKECFDILWPALEEYAKLIEDSKIKV